MEYFPLFTRLQHRTVLIIGGGDIATRKTQLLLKSGAKLRIIAPHVSTELNILQQQGSIELELRPYVATDLEHCSLIIAATNDRELNQQIALAAQAKNIDVNVVDDPKLSNVVLPALVDRDPVVIAISSSAGSPVLSRLLRAQLESLIPSRYGLLANLAKRFRQEVKNRFASSRERRQFWEQILDGPAAEQMLAGHDKAAERIISEALNNPDTLSKTGEVFLVGAGPGDPDLLTFRALRLMQKCDIVLYDRLVSDEILNLVRREAKRIYVGKARSDHALPQDEINEFLLREAKSGKRVLRLKGGDPFVFGRGGEEIMRLAEEGIPFQVVPSVTAANGCGAYAGIPLTHRDFAQSCTFVTGHTKDGKLDLNWTQLAQPNQTVVFYMGLANVHALTENLIAHGLDGNTPAAVVQNGTRPNQTVLVSSLENLARDAQSLTISVPSLIFVGHTVSLRQQLAWF
ncbi:MAG: siroheme synthase CysG [Gammaproteobacteria bacterium]|nr:siroheme synthase CysG [Gammaproteobacteria bacterium]